MKKKLLGKQRKEQHAQAQAQAQAQARRVSNMKQEMKRETNHNLMISSCMSTQAPNYWTAAEYSVHHPIQVSNSSIMNYDHLNNETSFTNLLHPTTIVDMNMNMNMNMTNPLSMVSDTNNGGSNCDHPPQIFEGFEIFSSDLSELVCVNQQQMEAFYGIDQSNGGSTITTSTESTSWGDMNSLVYSPNLVSDYEGSIPQDVATFEDSRYFKMQ